MIGGLGGKNYILAEYITVLWKRRTVTHSRAEKPLTDWAQLFGRTFLQVLKPSDVSETQGQTV